MKLPNGEHAIIDLHKVRDYILDPNHPTGKHKARVFRSVLGLTVFEAEELQDALARAARDGSLKIGSSDSFGTRYGVGAKRLDHSFR